jgi:hypothetical protein
MPVASLDSQIRVVDIAAVTYFKPTIEQYLRRGLPTASIHKADYRGFYGSI